MYGRFTNSWLILMANSSITMYGAKKGKNEPGSDDSLSLLFYGP